MSKAHDSECECQDPLDDCCCSYRAEIERLRGELDAAALKVSRLERLVWTPMDAYAEIERLRLQVKMIPCPEYRDDPRLHEVIDAQRAEIERLRELLGEAHLALSFMPDPTRKLLDLRYRVREALGE
jgi:hypothetical protein